MNKIHSIKDSADATFRNYNAEECTVYGMPAMILRISRVCGLAPLRLTRVRAGWRVAVSHGAAVYSFTLMFTLHTLVLTGGIMDMCLTAEHSVRGRTLTSRVLLVAELIVMLAINGLGVYNARRRMIEMIEQINVIEKTKSKITKYLIDVISEKKVMYVTASYIVTVCCLVVFDIFLFIDEAVKTGRDLRVACLYLFMYAEIFIVIIFELQFVAVALCIDTAFSAINKSLADLIHILDLQMKSHLYTLSEESSSMMSIPLPSTALSTAVDTMLTGNASDQAQYSSRSICGAVRRLVDSYGTLCDVTRQVNSTYGPMLLLTLASSLIHLVQSPYYFILYLLHDSNPTPKIVQQLLFLFFYVTNMVVIIEPGHRIRDKTQMTMSLVGQLLRRARSQQDPLERDLNQFITQMKLNRVAYSPLGVCELNRPLIATIFASVTTYLVIILQFQTM